MKQTQRIAPISVSPMHHSTLTNKVADHLMVKTKKRNSASSTDSTIERQSCANHSEHTREENSEGQPATAKDSVTVVNSSNHQHLI